MAAALGHAPTPAEQAYLSLLDRRLAALSCFPTGGHADLSPSAQDRACARRFLAPREGTWHDGDENLVRGLVEAWSDSSAAAPGLRAARVLEAAHALAGMNAPPTTLWFFLWEMESVLAGLEGNGAQR